MSPPTLLIALGVALVAGTAGYLLAARGQRRRGRPDAPRRLLRSLVQRRVLKGKPGFVRLFPGGYVHLIPEGKDVDRAMRPGEALAQREAHGEALVRFSLADLLDADHPAADAFATAAGLPEGSLPPARVLFTAVPHLVRGQVAAALGAEGVTVEAATDFAPTPDDPFGTVAVASGPYRHDLAVADLVAESVGTLTPLNLVAGDRAHRARAELDLYQAFHRTVEQAFPEAAVRIEGKWLHLQLPGEDDRRLDYRRLATRVPGGRPGWEAWLSRIEAPLEVEEPGLPEGTWVARKLVPLDALGDPERVAVDRGGYAEVFSLDTETRTASLPPDHPLAQANDLEGLGRLADQALERSTFAGHVVVTGEGDEPRSFMVVGTHAASIAQSPELLAGAARAAGHVFRPGERVRVRVEREAVLVVAEPTVPETFLTACRRAAARLAEATDVALGGPVHLDLTAPLGEKAVGHFAFVPLDDAFFRAALQERAARTRGDHAAAAEARGLMRLALGDPEGARVHLTEAARLHPDDAELHLALGTLLNDLGDHGAATEVLRVAARLDPDSAAVNNNLGVAWQGLGRVDEALLCFEKAAAEKPRDALVQVNLGRVHFDAGRVRRAERYFRRALDRAPRSVPALTGLVLVAVRDGDLETARQRLAEAMGVDPTDEALLRLHRALHPDEPLH